MMKKKTLVVAVILISILVLAGCGKRKLDYIDGVAYFNASNTEYATAIRSDPEYENPVIAREYEGRPVEDIAQDVFSGAVLTSIVIPDTIKYICPRASMDCPNLKEIIIEGAPHLRDGCFCRLPALESVTFGQGTESISMAVFEDCDALREIHVPAACQEITGDVPDSVTLVLQSEEVAVQAVENGWNCQMEDGTEVASMTLAEAIEAGRIEWDKEAANSGKGINIKNVSNYIIIVGWPENFELEADNITYYLPKVYTVTLKPGDSRQLETHSYTAYGPEEAMVQIAAESDYMYCRLYKENNKLDSEFLVEPHARNTLSLPCGQYSLRILSGKTAEDADPDTAEETHWSGPYIWNFEGGGSYEVCINAATRSYKLEKYGEYGPGESSLFLKVGDRSACYRLFRVGGELECEAFLEPGYYNKTVSFPAGRYKLRIAEGDTWISDEEAFGEEGRYSVIDYFNYEEGETYGITETTGNGNVYGDSAGGFGS